MSAKSFPETSSSLSLSKKSLNELFTFSKRASESSRLAQKFAFGAFERRPLLTSVESLRTSASPKRILILVLKSVRCEFRFRKIGFVPVALVKRCAKSFSNERWSFSSSLTTVRIVLPFKVALVLKT